MVSASRSTERVHTPSRFDWELCEFFRLEPDRAIAELNEDGPSQHDGGWRTASDLVGLAGIEPATEGL